MIWSLHAQGIGIFIHCRDVAVGECSDGFFVFDGTTDDFVVYVSDIANIGDFVLLLAKPALHHIEHHHDARMPEMTKIVDGHTAYVHAHLTRLYRRKYFLVTRQRVVNSKNTHE